MCFVTFCVFQGHQDVLYHKINMAMKKYSTSGELMKDIRSLDYQQQYKVCEEFAVRRILAIKMVSYTVEDM